MKFGRNLIRAAEISDPAWVPFWVNYKLLKKLINQLPTNQADNRSSESSSVAQKEGDSTAEESTAKLSLDQPQPEQHQQQESEVLGRCPAEVTFFRLLHSELQKSIRFYDRILEEHKIRVERLHEGREIFSRPGSMVVHDPWSCLARSSFKIYKDLLLLECYAILTFCAFSKILKKHDKVTGRSTRNAFMTSMVQGANFSDTTRLQQMIEGCESRYNEASSYLEKAGRPNLQEDERLFISMIARINNDIQEDAGTEGAPSAGSRVGRGLGVTSPSPTPDRKMSPQEAAKQSPM